MAAIGSHTIYNTTAGTLFSICSERKESIQIDSLKRESSPDKEVGVKVLQTKKCLSYKCDAMQIYYKAVRESVNNVPPIFWPLLYMKRLASPPKVCNASLDINPSSIYYTKSTGVLFSSDCSKVESDETKKFLGKLFENCIFFN